MWHMCRLSLTCVQSPPRNGIKYGVEIMGRKLYINMCFLLILTSLPPPPYSTSLLHLLTPPPYSTYLLYLLTPPPCSTSLPPPPYLHLLSSTYLPSPSYLHQYCLIKFVCRVLYHKQVT